MRVNFVQSPTAVLSSPGSLPGVAVRRSCCRRVRRILLPVLLLLSAAAPAHGAIEPTDLTATVGEGGVSLSWRASTTLVAPVTGYQVLRRHVGVDAEGVFKVIGTTGASKTTYTDAGVEGGETYVYGVKARLGDSVSGFSNFVRVDVPPPPSAPVNLSASVGDGTVRLSWDDAGNATIVAYQVRYKTAALWDPDWTDVDGSGASTTSHRVTGLTNGTAYTFEVRAKNAGGEGASSSVTATPVPPPLAPVNLSASVGDGTVRLSWDDAGNATIVAYQVRYKTGALWDPDWTDVDGSSASTTSHGMTGLTNGTAYTIEVRAKNAAGAGAAASVTATPVPPPSAPVNLKSASGHRYVTLKWDDPDDATITGYEVRYRTGATWDPDWTDVDGSDATTSHRVAGLTNGTRYTFEVRAQNAAGDGAAASVWATPVGFPPGNLSVSVVDGSVTLSWDAPGADAEFVSGYEVLRRWPKGDGPGIFYAIATTGASATTYMDGTVEGGERYVYRVKAWRGADLSLSSNFAAIRAPRVPAAPANLSASAGDGSVTLSWDDAADDTIAKYQYRYRTGMTWDPDWTDIAGSDDETVGFALTGLTNGTAYTFEVRAKNANGNGTLAGVTATPVPAAPANLRATAGVGEVTLNWDASGDAAVTAYQLKYDDGTNVVQDWSDIAGSGGSTTQHKVTGLTSGTAYTFKLRAKATDAAGDSSEVTATPLPAAPANLTAAAGVGQVALEWDDPGDAGITVYQLKYGRGTTVVQDWSDVSGTGASTTEHTVTGLTNGTAYTFKLRAKATVTLGDSSMAAATPVPAAPANLEATAGDGKVTLNWDNPGDAAITKYQLVHYSGSRPSQPTWSDISGSGATTTTHHVMNLTNDTEYTFELRAKATATPGDSSVVKATPSVSCPTLTIKSIADVTKAVGSSISIAATASGGCGTKTFSKKPNSNTPSWIRVSSGGSITGTVPTSAACRTHNVTLRVTDGRGTTDEESFRITVGAASRLTIRSIADVTKAVGSSISISATASGGCGTKTFSKKPNSNTPSWIRVSSGGSITGTVPPSAACDDHPVVVKVTDGRRTTDVESFKITVPGKALTILCPADQTATKGAAITKVTPSVGGGCPDYTFSMTGAPAGVGIDGDTGEISGKPTETGTFNVSVTVADGEENTASCTFSIAVSCPTISIAEIDDVTATKGAAMPSRTATASGGTSPYTYSLSDAPAGVNINIDDTPGKIGGTPTETGEFDVTVTARSACGCEGTREFKITVSCPTISIEEIDDVTVTKGTAMPSRTATASGGTSPYTYTISGEPDGVTINSSSGVIGGTPTETGEFDVTVTARSTCGCEGTRKFKITVSCPTIAVGGVQDVKVKVGDEIPTMTATASGGKSPYTFSLSVVPASGSDVTMSGGVIEGTVERAGVYTATVTATDSFGCKGTGTFKITGVDPPPLNIGDIPDKDATVNQAFPSTTASATGGKKPYSFSMSGAPITIKISATTGRITGTPNATSTSTVTVTVTDAQDSTDTDSFKLYVSNALSVASISDVVVTWQLDMDAIQVSASGGRSPYSYSLESEPAGISISSSGRISGTPTQLGSAEVTVIVKDRGKRRVTTSFSMTVARPGDFNGDGRRDAKDSAMFNRKFGLRSANADFDRRMDLNKDGVINMADLVILTRYIEEDASSGSGGPGG